MSDLPKDLIPNILSKLPVESLLRFKTVSKSWYSLIKDPKFIKMHLDESIDTDKVNLLLCHESSDSKLYSVDHDTSFLQAVEVDFPFNEIVPFHWGERTVYQKWVHISNSCHGLVCIYNHHGAVAIWNPSTKEFKELPKMHSTKAKYASSGGHIYYGLGYDSRMDDYKVVKISQYWGGPDGNYIGESDVLIYTMGTNSWGSAQDINFYIYDEPIPALISNDTFHWQAIVGEKDRYLIFSVDLKDEKARELPHPEGAGYGRSSLGTLRGNLCLLNDIHGTHTDFWEMKHYGVKESWTKIFTGSYSKRCLRMLWFTSSSEVVFVYDQKQLLLYDPKLEESKVVHTRGYPVKFIAQPYVGSLVSVKSSTFVGEKKAKRKRELLDEESTR